LKQALKEAFPLTLPIMAGYVFLGISFGLLATSQSISALLTVIMSLFIYSGATQFTAVNLLIASFDPIGSFLLAVMVSARHIFYGITMLPIYSQLSGWKKNYAIFALTDETFSLNVATAVPKNVDKNWFYFLTSFLNQSYWVIGTMIGVFLEKIIVFNIEGIEFILVAMFVAIFTEQWLSAEDHKPALLGLGGSLLMLVVFGSTHFMIPAMFFIIISLLIMEPKIRGEESV
jgi:4-azaleucine resistance transporter AzlC